jgi:PhoPQ-activated pathogenicity-related protein
VKLWQASNPEKRDFRLVSIGTAYKSTGLDDRGGGVYVGRIARPEKGWTAAFVEMTFPGGKYPLKFTSGVRVLPDTLPHSLPQQTGKLPQ